jgi:hypothetical protein
VAFCDGTGGDLRVLTNQCTGTPAYQGDQDDDPLNVTDCDERQHAGRERARRGAPGLQVMIRTAATVTP